MTTGYLDYETFIYDFNFDVDDAAKKRQISAFFESEQALSRGLVERWWEDMEGKTNKNGVLGDELAFFVGEDDKYITNILKGEFLTSGNKVSFTEDDISKFKVEIYKEREARGKKGGGAGDIDKGYPWSQYSIVSRKYDNREEIQKNPQFVIRKGNVTQQGGSKRRRRKSKKHRKSKKRKSKTRRKRR
jgi:hypothetical protein